MWAVLDANSYFCSVEKVFHPGLAGKPAVVLSSNDGIIVALTPEAKALGLHRGDPLFKVRSIVERNHVNVFSTNMMLYAAMSKRVQNIIRQSVDYCESYSIDEIFADLSGFDSHFNLEEYMRGVALRIKLWTDIPVSVGVAPTKTLAKMGSKFAKNFPGYRSVCMIDSDAKRRKALELFELDDVWGVGRRTYEKLLSLGVRTPLEFADKPGEWVHRHFTKPGVQTWKELNGYPCVDTAEVLKRQSITTSRSFGQMITTIEQVKASVASFAASCANKLRAQASSAGTVSVFLCSNFFREDLPQYFNMASYSFPVATADTIEITRAAMAIVDEIYRPGIKYKKSGVLLGDIVNGGVQQNLFDPVPNRKDRLELSKTLDSLNQKFGLKTVRLAVEGGKTEEWKVKSEHRSPNYLTSLDDILTVQI
ncbi:MAG: Y-family DNA polymerase [Bacteroidales bacterium]|nr:Y-family DNA polymerase [Candidatus Cacconaster merdequi]